MSDTVCLICGSTSHTSSSCPSEAARELAKPRHTSRARAHLRSVTCLDDIRYRCRIDEDTGCWSWAWAKSKSTTPTPVTHIAAGVLGFDRYVLIPAYRAAWLFVGNKIPEGHVVYRRCCNTECCNPEHLKTGTKKQMHAHYSKSGKNKGKPHRRIVNAISSRKMMTPPERVKQVEDMLAVGYLQKQIMAALHMDGETVRRIRDGRHPNCSRPVSRALPGASVFSWGMV